MDSKKSGESTLRYLLYDRGKKQSSKQNSRYVLSYKLKHDKFCVFHPCNLQGVSVFQRNLRKQDMRALKDKNVITQVNNPLSSLVGRGPENCSVPLSASRSKI